MGSKRREDHIAVIGCSYPSEPGETNVSIFRTTSVIVLLAFSVNVHAICPIGEDARPRDRGDVAVAYDPSDEPISYTSVGEMSNGTVVLHAVGSQGANSEVHELLLVRPAGEPNTRDGENLRPVRLGGEDYVVERVEPITIDKPCDGTVSVEGDEVVVTIVASP